MKVILLKDVAKIGKKGSIVEVPDGFAQNKLLPNKMAKPASAENIKQVQHEAQVKAEVKAHSLDDFKHMLTLLREKPCVFVVNANKEGHMFEALKIGALCEGIRAHTKMKLEESEVSVSSPIKSVGEHTIVLSRAGYTDGVIIIVKHL
jgi:large subunit ribosomal protein L9